MTEEGREAEDSSPSAQTLTLLDAEAAGPLIQSDVLVVVQVTGLEKAGGAVLHGDEGGTQWGQLGVGQVPAGGEEEEGGKGLRREKATGLLWDLQSSTAPPEPQFPPPSEGEALTTMSKALPVLRSHGLITKVSGCVCFLIGQESGAQKLQMKISAPLLLVDQSLV